MSTLSNATGPESLQPDRRRRLGLLLLVCALGAFGAHALLLWERVGRLLYDDAYILFRYGRNLALGHGPVFNPGERVEGYTSPLWMLMSAAAEAAGLHVEMTALVLAMVCGAVAMIVAWRAAGGGACGALAAWLLALNGSFAAAVPIGMETLAFGVALASAMFLGAHEVSVGRPSARSGTLYALAYLCRPEAAAMVALHFGIAALRWRGDRARLRELCISVAPAVLTIAAHVVWRVAYYGDLLPNTFHAKVSTDIALWLRGLSYTGTFVLANGALVGIPLVAWLVAKRGPQDRAGASARHLALLGVGYALLVTALGGDWDGALRFYVPLLPVYAVLVALGVDRMFRRWRRLRTGAVILGIGMCLLTLIGSWSLAEPTRWLARHETLLAEFDAVGRWLARHVPPDTTIETAAAGLVPYRSGLYTIDLYGLTVPYVARLDIPMGDGLAGHEKSDAAYLLARAPALMLDDVRHLALQQGGPELEREFDARYEAWRVDDLGLTFYVRRDRARELFAYAALSGARTHLLEKPAPE